MRKPGKEKGSKIHTGRNRSAIKWQILESSEENAAMFGHLSRRCWTVRLGAA